MKTSSANASGSFSVGLSPARIISRAAACSNIRGICSSTNACVSITAAAHHHWTFQGDEEPIQLNVAGRLQSNNADILREAAIGGGGVALLADWLVRDDVAAGRLTRLLEHYEVNPGSASSCINAL